MACVILKTKKVTETGALDELWGIMRLVVASSPDSHLAKEKNIKFINMEFI